MTLESITRFLAEDSSPFELKGSLFTLTVMHLRRTDWDAVAYHLAQKVRQAPGFFNNIPVVVDLQALSPDATVDFGELWNLLRRQGMVPVGVRNGASQLQTAAVRAGFAVLPENRALTPKPNDQAVSAVAKHNKIIHQPIRSGQQVYAPDGDLILLGPISVGAEVLADGNIHVYGTLRGRALAGVKGDIEARIFCTNLEAELVSIAGRYRTIEELEPENRDTPVQLYLSEDRLIISPLPK
ncbi:MAG: septum site-determining protein MinC [Candidatus Competibacteraceae bacterium]|jgi:septum site-determining protein MinC|nr:septum site-determining protein MinC [Candidatus Competibacteraceae bacterium]